MGTTARLGVMVGEVEGGLRRLLSMRGRVEATTRWGSAWGGEDVAVDDAVLHGAGLRVRSIHVDYDGHVRSTGSVLRGQYRDVGAANRLVDLGDIRSLHDEADRIQRRVTLGDDWADVQPVEHGIRFVDWPSADWYYLFDGTKWWYSQRNSRVWNPLEAR